MGFLCKLLKTFKEVVMNKKVITGMIASAMILSLCQMSALAEENTEAASQETAASEDSALSDDLYSFELLLDGELYQFPMSYEEFTAKGWTYKDDDTIEIKPNSYSPSERFTKGSLEIYASVINLGINTLPLSECTVGGISMDEWQYKDAPETTLELPGGITYGISTLEDITAAYGPASDTYEGDLYTKLEYEYDYYQDWELYVSTETGLLNEVDVRNFVADEEANSSAAAEVSDEPTPEVLAYEAPTELGDDPGTFTVDYAGDLYQLPAPVSFFEEKGWTIKREVSDSIIPGRSFGWVSMLKDNQELKVIARNYNDNATVIDNCFVTTVKANVYGPELSLTLPGGITMGMTEEELTAVLESISLEQDVEESDSFTYYNLIKEASRSTIQIIVKKEDGVVTGMEVQNDPKTLE